MKFLTLEGGDVCQRLHRRKACPSDAVSLRCHLHYVERNVMMISKHRTERDGLASFEALSRRMIERLKRTMKYFSYYKLCPDRNPNMAQPDTSCSFCLPEGNVKGDTGSKIVVVTSLAAASDEAS